MSCSVSHVTQSTVHCTDKELYTEEPPTGICSILCSSSCSHIARVSYKLLMLLVGSSRLYSIHHQASCSSPIHLVTEALERGHHLGPTVTSLVGSSLGVLDECSLCRRQTINSSVFLSEQLFPCLVHTFLCAGAIVQQDHKSLQWLHLVINGTWVWHGTQGTECWCDASISGLAVPCSLLASAAKTGHHVTTSEGMEHQQSHTSVRTKSFGYLMNLKLFPAPKAIHSSEMLRQLADAIARTTTSVSTVHIDTLLYPFYGIL